MVEKLNIDKWSRSIVTEKNICNALYLNPSIKYDHVELEYPGKYNQAIDLLYLNYSKLEKIEPIDLSVEEFHALKQQEWFMPEQYVNLDIAQWLLEKCKNETEIQRVGKELLMYAEREQLDLLKYLKYLVDTMRQNNIVWGVGRGSSVASFVLYLIGVHKINSITYNLDIEEFIR